MYLQLDSISSEEDKESSASDIETKLQILLLNKQDVDSFGKSVCDHVNTIEINVQEMVYCAGYNKHDQSPYIGNL